MIPLPSTLKRVLVRCQSTVTTVTCMYIGMYAVFAAFIGMYPVFTVHCSIMHFGWRSSDVLTFVNFREHSLLRVPPWCCWSRLAVAGFSGWCPRREWCAS